MGGNNTKCKIGTSNVDQIFDKFNKSYYYYINDPLDLCSAFSEYANDEENIFITAGCYLKEAHDNNDKHRRICTFKFENDVIDRGYACI